MRSISWFAVLALVVTLGGMTGAEPQRTIAGIERWLVPGRLFLLGELHGTQQSPAFAASVVAAAAASELDVVVGLELSSLAQSSLDLYVASQGEPHDREALLAHPVWQSSYQDGRTSRAMLELVESVRRIRGLGGSVRVVAFDVPGARNGQQRDRLMAQRLARSTKDRPDAVHVVLTGNLHSRAMPGNRLGADYEPMGYLLQSEVGADRLLALDVAHEGGTAWICGPDCGVVQLRGRNSGTAWSIEVADESRPAGHHGWYHVGELTASLPATRGPADASETVGGSSARPRVENPAPPKERRLPSEPPDSPAVGRLQGNWQAYNEGVKSWQVWFDGLSFYAEVGPDDWYKGEISIRPDKKPAQIDFHIEDCRCGFKGQSSDAIYRWEGETMIVATPQPGSRRPAVFNRESGQVVDLRRVED